FRNCFHVLMGEQTKDYACDPKKAKEYSDAISHKLTAWYSKPHIDPIRFQFLLEAKRHKSKEFAEYPCANGYMLLVIPTDPNLNASRRLRGVLASAIDNAIQAEFDVYRKLPEYDPVVVKAYLMPYFDPDGPACARILKDLATHHNNNEVISNPDNPSTRPQLRQVLEVEVLADSATVKVKEYWNLHWFCIRQNVYVKPWQGQNEQEYKLIKRDNRWLVKANPYDHPR